MFHSIFLDLRDGRPVPYDSLRVRCAHPPPSSEGGFGHRGIVRADGIRPYIFSWWYILYRQSLRQNLRFCHLPGRIRSPLWLKTAHRAVFLTRRALYTRVSLGCGTISAGARGAPTGCRRVFRVGKKQEAPPGAVLLAQYTSSHLAASQCNSAGKSRYVSHISKEGAGVLPCGGEADKLAADAGHILLISHAQP